MNTVEIKTEMLQKDVCYLKDEVKEMRKIITETEKDSLQTKADLRNLTEKISGYMDKLQDLAIKQDKCITQIQQVTFDTDRNSELRDSTKTIIMTVIKIIAAAFFGYLIGK